MFIYDKYILSKQVFSTLEERNNQS